LESDSHYRPDILIADSDPRNFPKFRSPNPAPASSVPTYRPALTGPDFGPRFYFRDFGLLIPPRRVLTRRTAPLLRAHDSVPESFSEISESQSPPRYWTESCLGARSPSTASRTPGGSDPALLTPRFGPRDLTMNITRHYKLLVVL